MAINRELALGNCFTARLDEPPQELDCRSMLEHPAPDLTEAVWMSCEPPMTTIDGTPTIQVPSLAPDNSKRELIQCPACFRESKDRVIIPLSCHSALELYNHLQVEHQSDLDLYLGLEQLSTKYNIQLLTPAEAEAEVQAQDIPDFHGWMPEVAMPEVPTDARRLTVPETRPAMRCPICVRRKTEEQHKTYQDAFALYMHVHLAKSHEVEPEHGLGMDELADRFGLPQYSSYMVPKRKHSDVDKEPCDPHSSYFSSGSFKRHKATYAEAEQEAEQGPELYFHEPEPSYPPRSPVPSRVQEKELAPADSPAALPLQQEQEYQLAPSPEATPQSSPRPSPEPSTVPLIDEIRCPYCLSPEKGPVFNHVLYWRAHMQLKHHDEGDAYLTYTDLAAKYHLPITQAECQAHRKKGYSHFQKKVKAVYCLDCPVGNSQLCIEESKYENGLYGLKDLREHMAAVHHNTTTLNSIRAPSTRSTETATFIRRSSAQMTNSRTKRIVHPSSSYLKRQSAHLLRLPCTMKTCLDLSHNRA
jgi:hypothetical protein